MGFYWGTEEQRLRINLSQKAYQTMTEDMLLFNEKERSSFVNRVFANFYEQAQASSYIYLERKTAELKTQLKDVICEEESKKLIIQALIDQEKQRLKENFEKQRRNKAVSKTYRMNNDNTEYLTGAECHEETFYEGNINLYVKCILEEYSELPYYMREQIYYREYYDEVEKAIAGKLQLKVALPNGQKYHVYPYKLDQDSLSTRTYLAGYSKPCSDLRAKKQICSFRLPRLTKVDTLKDRGNLSKSEIAELEKAMETRSIQFLLTEEEEIHVQLTEAGVAKYNQQIYMRPAKVEEKSTKNEYVFYCTPYQAEQYFFKFGAEARILSPESLRTRFAELYVKAADAYNNMN